MYSRQLKLQLDYKSIIQESDNLSHIEITKKYLDLSKKNLTIKTTGKFYTPEVIGKPLAKLVASGLDNKTVLSIIDPFCGDGRLIKWFIESIAKPDLHLEIFLWDYDANAVELAKQQVLNTLKNSTLSYTIHAKQVDSFNEFYNNNYENTFDIVITNPPWDIVKPDKNELNHLDKTGREGYIKSLKQFSNRLLNDFAVSRPAQMYGGWGVNLARVGTELAIRLAKNKGVVGLVSPASLLADQNSIELRKWLFGGNNCSEINYYPAESRLFEGVDLPSISMVLKRGCNQESIKVNNFDKNLSLKFQDNFLISENFFKEIDYKIPISFAIRSQGLKQLEKFQKLPSFESLTNRSHGYLWTGRELDETNHRNWTTSSGEHVFVKGKMIDRFSHTSNPQTFISKAKEPEVPKSVNFNRIVWRDVSRPTQKRRIIATLIQPGWVTGNSLGVAYFKDDPGNSKLLTLLGIMSSLVFEFQIRSLLATSHISVGVVRKTRIPDFSNIGLITKVSNLVERRLKGDEEAEIDLEVYSAKSYGLIKDDFKYIIDAFPKIEDEYKHKILNSHSWNYYD